MTDKIEEFKKKLAVASEEFAIKLPDRLLRLQKQWALCKHDFEKKTEPLQELLTEAHKLAGICGTYGFGEIGLFRSEIEKRLLQVREKKRIESEDIEAVDLAFAGIFKKIGRYT